MLIAIYIYGCDGGGDAASSGSTPEEGGITSIEGEAKSENQFLINPALHINADRDIYLTFLESTSSKEELNLTGETGFDEFSYVYEEAINHTICWVDDDPGAEHSMSLLDNTSAEILSVEANGDCVNQIIPAGIYKVRVFHDNLSDEILSVFFIPDITHIASNDDIIIVNFFASIKSLIHKFHFTKTSYAQEIPFDITTMIKTGSCTGCNLENILLRGQYLSGANLEGGNLMSAILDAANFSNTNLMGSNLISADLRGTNFSGADLRAADLSISEIDQCTNFLDADLTSAIWVTGCQCSDFVCSNCGEIPMTPAPEGPIAIDDCDTIRGPGSDDPGGPVQGPVDDPGDVPLLP